MLALVRPDAWNLPLFLHVLGATVTAGGVTSVVIAGLGARGRTPEQAALLARIAFRALIFVVVPAFIVMRAAAQWIADKEFPSSTKTPGWVDVGFIVTEPGALLLVALIVISYLAARRGGVGRLATTVPILAGIYLAALAVAWWVMSAKPGA